MAAATPPGSSLMQELAQEVFTRLGKAGRLPSPRNFQREFTRLVDSRKTDLSRFGTDTEIGLLPKDVDNGPKKESAGREGEEVLRLSLTQTITALQRYIAKDSKVFKSLDTLRSQMNAALNEREIRAVGKDLSRELARLSAEHADITNLPEATRGYLVGQFKKQLRLTLFSLQLEARGNAAALTRIRDIQGGLPRLDSMPEVEVVHDELQQIFLMLEHEGEDRSQMIAAAEGDAAPKPGEKGGGPSFLKRLFSRGEKAAAPAATTDDASGPAQQPDIPPPPDAAPSPVLQSPRDFSGGADAQNRLREVEKELREVIFESSRKEVEWREEKNELKEVVHFLLRASRNETRQDDHLNQEIEDLTTRFGAAEEVEEIRALKVSLKNVILQRLFQETQEVKEREEVLKKTLTQLLAEIQLLNSESDTFGGRIDSHIVSLTKALSLEDIQHIQQTIIDELGKVRETNRTLKNRLETVSKEAETLRGELTTVRTYAMIDELTKAYTRRSFEDTIASKINLYRQTGVGFSLILYDIDHFKKVNDTYGHGVGDQVLFISSEIIRKNMRKSDLLARYGGEEFVVLLPGMALEDAVRLGDQLRSILAAAKFVFREENLTVTASFGVSSIRQGDDRDALVNRVDKALYLAKSSGRNRVCSESDLQAAEGEPPAAGAGEAKG